MTLQDIQNEVSKKYGVPTFWEVVGRGMIATIFRVADESAKRYATECCKATLEKAADTGIIGYKLDPETDIVVLRMVIALNRQKIIYVSKDSITNPENITLL